MVDKIPQVEILFLGENEINSLDEVKPLKNLKELQRLDISNTNLAKQADYRNKVFDLLPELEVNFFLKSLITSGPR